MSNRQVSTAARLLFPLAIAMSVAGAIPAAAQSEPTAMQKIFGALGLLELPKDPIDYRERAPLVVPPSAGLIPPRGSDDMRQYNPDWPVDHDDRIRNTPRDLEAEAKADEDFYSGRALLPSELSRGRISRSEAAQRASTKGTPEGVDSTQRVLSPSELGFKGWGKKQEERVVFTGEPERRSLTEPPPGLRTPSLDAPYGVVSSKPTAAKSTTLYERVDGTQNK